MKQQIKSLICLSAFLFIQLSEAKSQLVVSGALTPQQLVQNVLVGGGITVSGVTAVNPGACLGSFSNGNTTNLGLDQGIILSTGGFATIPNPNTFFLSNGLGGAGDLLLDQMSGNNGSYDAVILEFDFVPLSNIVNFRYVFGSEEYPEYVCSTFNDAFGFFVTGPDPMGGSYTNKNIALIPGTSLPVTINSVNNGTVGSYGTSGNCTSLAYSMYYVTNNGATICFDGFTTPLTATVEVVPCQSYHIKLAISDIGDGVYDSGVFLEANSFQADAVDLDSYYTNPLLGLNAIEGCSDGIISFTLNQPATQNVTVTYTIGGTAVNGVDYNTIPNYIVIPAGSDSVALIIDAIMDGLGEGTETVILSVQTSPCGTQNITLDITDNTPVVATVSQDQTICDGQQPVNFNVAASGGVSPLTLNWSNGLGTNPNVTTSPPVGSYTYYVTATDACGATATDNINIIVNATPTAFFSVVSPICAGDPSSIIYSGTSGPGATFTWNLSGATILNGTPGPNPFTITWNTAGTYPVSLVVQSAEGCTSVIDTHYVQVLGAGTPNCCLFPTPDAGPPQTFCGLQGQFQATMPDDPSYVGTWVQLTGPGFSNFTDEHLTYTTVSVTLPGVYSYQWNEVNGPCDSADVCTMTFIQNPVANAGPDGSVCGMSFTMAAVMSTPGSGIWSGGPGIANPTSPTTQINAGVYGTFSYAWTETNSGCSSVDSVTVEFLVTPSPNAGPDNTACGNRYTLDADSAFPGYWTGPANVIYVDGYTLPQTGIIVPNYAGSQYVATFTWNESNGSCTASDNVNITFIRPPLAEAGLTQSICGTVTQMQADTIGSGIISASWYCNTPGVVITETGNDPIPWDAIVDISLLGSNAYHFSVGEYYLFFLAQNGQGCTSVDSVKIVFYDIPVAYAGIDTAVCGKSFAAEGLWSLDNHTGIWTPIPGNPGSANFSPNNVPNTFISVTQYGDYDFIWREMNAANSLCYDQDTINIDFMTQPMPDAGLDFKVCGRFAQISATPSVPGGQWSCPQGGVQYYDANNGNITPSNKDSATTWIRYPSENVTVTMYWTEFNDPCYGYDSVNVTFLGIPPAVELVGAADTVVCGPVFTLLNAQPPTYGNGYWIDTVPNTTFAPSPMNPSPSSATIDTGSDDYYGYHNFYWITVNDICRDTSDLVRVKFIKYPEAYAGGNYWPGLFGPNSHIKTDTVCGLNTQMEAIPSIGQGTWYSLDPQNVYFVQGNGTSTPVYNDSLYLTCAGCYTVFNMVGDKYREFVWQENNEGCVHSDTIRLYFAPHPTGTFTVTMPWCRHYESMIIATTWPAPNNVDYGITSFQWTYPNGVLSPQIPNPTVSDTIYVSWPTGETHNVTLITSNQWDCSSGVVSHTVIEPQPFSVSSLQEPASCLQDNGSVTLSTSYGQIPQYYTFHWFPDSLYPNPLSVTQDGLSPFSYHTVQVTGESYSVDAPPGTNCYDTLTFFVRDTGAITAQFDTISFQQHQAAPYDVQFINQTINGKKYSWRIYDENGNLVYTSTAEHPAYSFDEEGCYEIVLIATSKFDCRDTAAFIPLCVDAIPVLEIPNVFTPNNDGMNDLFRVHGKSIVEFKAIIFNRWGKKVYEWDDVNGYWDGKIGSSDASPGTYYYIITAKDKKKTEYEEKGFFYLLREK